MKVYESGIILDPELEDSQIDKQVEQVESLIKSKGGKILEINRWGMRRLAYEIQKKKQGYYVFFVFEGEGPMPQQLEKAYLLNETIMRFMTVVADWEGGEEKADQPAPGPGANRG